MNKIIEIKGRTFKIQRLITDNGWDILENDQHIASFYNTYHPTIPFEVFLKGDLLSNAKRVHSTEEAIEFFLEKEKESMKI